MSDGTCNTDCPVSSYSIANFLSKGKRENAKEAKKYKTKKESLEKENTEENK